MGYWAKDGSFVRDASDDAPRMTQGDAWEAGQRVIKGMQDFEAAEKRRKEAEREARIEYKETERAIEKQRAEALKFERNKIEAVKIIVEKRRQEYNQKSWFGKAVATLRGKTFAKMRSEIEDYATRRVDNMSPDQLEYFIESNSEQKGRSI